MKLLPRMHAFYKILGCEGQNELIETTSSTCVCPGGILTYECTVFGGTLDVITVWKGDFFNCPTGIGEIHLIHGQS